MARPRFIRRHLKAAYRSGLEATISAAIVAAGVPLHYEEVKVPYTQPAKARNYTPDWFLPNGIVVEGKGLFALEDRAKHLLVKAQHPDLDIRFVFSNPLARISKGSPTTYATWCEKNGFLYAKKVIPQAWYKERANARSLKALRDLGARVK